MENSVDIMGKVHIMGKEFSFEYFHINEKFNKIFIRKEIIFSSIIE
jgi:hypothetical protein